jgi:hypothetical protein
VLRQLVPALLLVVPATAASWAGIEFVQAAEECRARPGSTAPPGSGWYYRLNRADHRRCWFLGAKSTSAHLTRHRQLADQSTGGVRREQQSGAQPQIGSSQIEPADGALPAARAAVTQAAAPTLNGATEYLVPRSIPTVTFRQPSLGAQAPMELIVKGARAVEQPSASAGNPTPSLVALAEAAATSLLFVGGSLFLVILLRRRSQRQAILGGSDLQMATSFGVPVVRAPPTASRLPNMQPVAANDFTQSLRELRRNLRRAETSIQRGFSERAFSNRSRESAF